MATYKYIGTLLEGRWIVEKRIDKKHYLLRNTYNSRELTIERRTLKRFVNNEITVSHYISTYILKGKPGICKRKVNFPPSYYES